MNRAITMLALAILTLGPGPERASAQEQIPESMRARRLPRQKLSGPRFGFTAFTGDVADFRRAAGKSAVMSQFGWQFETQVVSGESGHQALMEWIVLVGGAEQNEFNTSLAWLAGLRMPGGFEVGVGPNLSLPSSGDPTTSMVVATGATFPFGGLYLPANLAVAFGRGGPRFTALVGWIIG
jgi:hypothetical protein